MSRYLSTSLSQVPSSAVSHVRAAYKPRANAASEGNGIWTNDNFERPNDHRPVSFVGQIAEEVAWGEAKLVLAAKGGAQTAFEQLVEQYEGRGLRLEGSGAQNQE